MNFLKKILFSRYFLTLAIALTVFLSSHYSVMAVTCTTAPDGIDRIGGVDTGEPCVKVNTGTTATGGTGFSIPTLSGILTFAIRMMFIVGGLAALIFLLLGALAWITSGGDKENVSKAQQKITNAIIGVILIAVVLAVIVTLEQVVFAGRICLGLSCPITIPSLLPK